QIELHGKFHVLVERFFDVGALGVLLKLSDIEPKLLGNPQGLILVSPAGLGEQLLVHLKIFALLVRAFTFGRLRRVRALSLAAPNCRLRTDGWQDRSKSNLPSDAALFGKLLIGSIDSSDFLGRERYKLRRHTTRDHSVRMIIENQLAVVPLQ